jgi:hypothetical protein
MNKGIKYIIVAALAAAATVSSHALSIQVNLGAGGATYLTDMAGTYLEGALVQVGTFATTPTDGSASLAGFSVFDSGLTAAGSPSIGSLQPETGFAGNQIYIAVFNASTSAAATEHALFYVNKADLPAWKFPLGTDIPNSTTLDVQDLISNPGTPGASLVTGGHLVYGQLGYDSNYGGITMIQTIPEPSTIALVGFGLIGAVGLMRRRRS